MESAASILDGMRAAVPPGRESLDDGEQRLLAELTGRLVAAEERCEQSRHDVGQALVLVKVGGPRAQEREPAVERDPSDGERSSCGSNHRGVERSVVQQLDGVRFGSQNP